MIDERSTYTESFALNVLQYNAQDVIKCRVIEADLSRTYTYYEYNIIVGTVLVVTYS